LYNSLNNSNSQQTNRMICEVEHCSRAMSAIYKRINTDTNWYIYDNQYHDLKYDPIKYDI